MKKRLVAARFQALFCVPARARTVDPLIKSQLLYQLSYRDISRICCWDGKVKEKS